MTAPYSPLYLSSTGIIPSPSRTSTTPATASPSRIPPISLESPSGLSRTSPQYSPRTSPSRFPPSPERMITPSRPEVRLPPYSLDRRGNFSPRRRENQLTIQIMHRNLSDKDIKKFLKIILKNLLGFGKFALMKIHSDLYRVYFDSASDIDMVFDFLTENNIGFGLELIVTRR